MAATCPYVYPGGQQCNAPLQNGRPYCDRCGIRALSEAPVSENSYQPPPIPPYPTTIERVLSRLHDNGDEVDAVNLIQLTSTDCGGIWGVQWCPHTHTCNFGYYSLQHFETIMGQRFDMGRIHIERGPTTHIYTIPSPDAGVQPAVIEINIQRGWVELEGVDDEDNPLYSIIGWFQLFGPTQ